MIDLVIALVILLIVKLLLGRVTYSVRVAHAGHIDSNKSNIRKVVAYKNRPVYKVGVNEINVSKLVPLIVEGCSLEPLGIKDESTIYVEEIENIPGSELTSLIGRFIVLKIDNERSLQEYPMKNISVVDGLKARKVIDILSTKLVNSEIRTKINNIIKNDQELNNYDTARKEEFKNRIEKKYFFASSYYKNEEYLIMSVTYKNGSEKDLSFHSPKYLYGVVRYNSI